jgi:aryl-alcohol dehydrogenase-like predicted oxidoreductase
VHWPDPLVQIEETAEAMQTLFDHRVAKLHVVQPPYNLFEREIEAELLPYCRQSGLTTLTYGALCRGLLSGKLQENAQFGGDDLDRILREAITDPVGPEFMAPPPRSKSAILEAAE